MNTGMLWFDNDPHTTLSVKIQKAMDYYIKKYGCTPNLCLVHPNMFEQGQKQIELGELTIRPYRSVIPGHLWIGVDEDMFAPVQPHEANS